MAPNMRARGRHSRRGRSDLSDFAPKDRRMSDLTKTLITAIGALLCLAVLVSLIEGAFQREADASTITRQRDALLKAEKSASDAAHNSSRTADEVAQLSKLLTAANNNSQDSRTAISSLQRALAKHGYSSVVRGGKVIVVKGPLPKSLMNQPGASETTPSPSGGSSTPAAPAVMTSAPPSAGLHRSVPAPVQGRQGSPHWSTSPKPSRQPRPTHKSTWTPAPTSTATTRPSPTRTTPTTSTRHPSPPVSPTSTRKPPLPIPTVTVTIPGLPPIVLLSGTAEATQPVANLLPGWVGTITATTEGAG